MFLRSPQLVCVGDRWPRAIAGLLSWNWRFERRVVWHLAKGAGEEVLCVVIIARARWPLDTQSPSHWR